MKKLFILMILCLIVPTALAINVDVEKISSDETIIRGVNETAEFEIAVTNNDDSNSFSFFSYVSPDMKPKEKIFIEKGETKNLTLVFYNMDDVTKDDLLLFNYYIKSEDGTKVKKELLLNIKDLKDAFKIEASKLNPNSSKVQVSIMNKLSYDFDSFLVNFSSPFFNFGREFSLNSYEEKRFDVSINKSDFQRLTAGYYNLHAKVFYKNAYASYDSPIAFQEKKDIKTTEEKYGFFSIKDSVTKVNQGNIVATSMIDFKKNIISRLFTTFNEKPDVVEREGFNVYYSWNRELEPGETLNIVAKTNWWIPFVIVIFTVLVVVLIKKISERDVDLRKRIHFVKAKGGEFALKVSIVVNSKRHVENLRVVDRIPKLAKLYERYGGEVPTDINKERGKLSWELGDLESGEKRILTYVIYSKIGVLGRFALPPAVSYYQRDGDFKESSSNRAYFVADQSKKEE